MIYEMLKDGVRIFLDARKTKLVKKQMALIERRFWHWNGREFITLTVEDRTRFVTLSHARDAIGKGWSEALEKMQGLGYIEPAKHPGPTLDVDPDGQTGFTYTGVGRAIVDESRAMDSWTRSYDNPDAGTL